MKAGQRQALKCAREAPLGRVLMAKGWLDDETLAEAIAFQSELGRGTLDGAALERHRDQLPLDTIVRYRVLPQGVNADGLAVVLTASPLGDALIAQLEAQLGLGVEQRIVREGDIAAGLRRLRGVANARADVRESIDEAASHDGQAQGQPARVPLLGDLLIERGYVRRQAFEAALTDYLPDRHGRIGDFIVARGVVSREAIEDVVREQRLASGTPGALA